MARPEQCEGRGHPGKNSLFQWIAARYALAMTKKALLQNRNKN